MTTAVYNVWSVGCVDGTTFAPRAWYLPKTGAVFFLYDENPQAQALMATVHTGLEPL